MIALKCSKYASASSANLSSLRIAALLITYYAFSRFDELAKLRCCDAHFHNLDYVETNITSSKTDIYRDGSSVFFFLNGIVVGSLIVLRTAILFFQFLVLFF